MQQQVGKVNTLYPHPLAWSDRPLAAINLLGGPAGTTMRAPDFTTRVVAVDATFRYRLHLRTRAGADGAGPADPSSTPGRLV